MSDDQPDPIREIRTELINHADPIVRQAYEYIIDLELAHAAEVERLTAQRDWHRVRNDALQKAQRHMRDPERKVVCDILANGTTYAEPFRTALGEA